MNKSPKWIKLCTLLITTVVYASGVLTAHTSLYTNGVPQSIKSFSRRKTLSIFKHPILRERLLKVLYLINLLFCYTPLSHFSYRKVNLELTSTFLWRFLYRWFESVRPPLHSLYLIVSYNNRHRVFTRIYDTEFVRKLQEKKSDRLG